MMVGRGSLTASPRGKMHDGNGLRDHVQMEMVSRTHKCLQVNGLIDHLTGVEKMQMAKVSQTNASHTVNSHPSYLLLVL